MHRVLVGFIINLRIKNLCWEKFLFLEIHKISNDINARCSIYYFCAPLGSEKNALKTCPYEFRWIFLQIMEYITYSCKINMKMYSFFSWWIWPLKKETNYRIDAIFDRRTKYSKFGSETTTAWLFLSCYVCKHFLVIVLY